MTTYKATSTLSCLLKAWLWFSETGEHLLVHRQGFQFLSCLGGGLLGMGSNPESKDACSYSGWLKPSSDQEHGYVIPHRWGKKGISFFGIMKFFNLKDISFKETYS